MIGKENLVFFFSRLNFSHYIFLQIEIQRNSKKFELRRNLMHATNFQHKPHKWEIVEVITFEGCCYSNYSGAGVGLQWQIQGVGLPLMVSIPPF